MASDTIIENAAFEAHMAAAESIKASGIRNGVVDIESVTKALARAYGDAFALLIASGADNDTLVEMGRTYADAVKDMTSRIHTKDCMGRA